MRQSYLLLRSDGFLWAVPGGELSGIASDRQGVRVACGNHELAAQEVVGLARELSVRPASSLLQRLLPYPCSGVAVAGGVPVVAIDPAAPPPALHVPEGDPSDGE